MGCLNCGNTLVKKSQKKFCSRSCAATINNKQFPKRFLESVCQKCEKPVSTSRLYCSDSCRNSVKAERFAKKTSGAQRVGKRRRLIKEILVLEAGGECTDCSLKGPPFIFDFDHRNPDEKSFAISRSNVVGLKRLREEVKKCDLVCAICHRKRTHKQRCNGCEYCD